MSGSGSSRETGKSAVRRNVAIVGLGAAARKIHIPAIRKLGRLSLVAGADPDMPEGFGFPVFPALGPMLDAVDVEIVVIATPPVSHYELVLEALAREVHVFCEKPFVMELRQAEDLVRRADEAESVVVVNNEFRFMNVHRAAKAKIGGPDFGTLQFVQMIQTFRTSAQTEAGWRGEGDRRTCFEFGTHALDLCRYFFESDPRAITARMPRPGGGGGPDLLNLIELEFEGDRFAQITLDRLSRGRHRYLDTRLDGTEATIEARLGGRAEIALGIRGGTRRPYAKVDFAPSAAADLFRGECRRRLATDPLDIFAHSTARLLSEMLDALDAGREPPCSAADNVMTLRLMLEAYASSDAGGRRIALDSGLTEPKRGAD